MRRWRDGLPSYCDFAASLVDRANTRDNAWVVVFTLLDSMPPRTTHVPPQYHSTTTLNCSGQQPFLKKQHSAQCQPHIVLQHKEHKKISRIAVCKLSSLTSDLWIFGPFCTCASGSVGWSVGCLVVFSIGFDSNHSLQHRLHCLDQVEGHRLVGRRKKTGEQCIYIQCHQILSHHQNS